MADLSILRNLYWRIRYHSRNKSTKRKYYRHVFKEKERLIESGMDREELCLICRVLSKRHCVHAERRLEAYRSIMIKDRIFS